jgi:microcystin-dependent protein
MTLIVYPFRPVPGDPEDVTQIMANFDAITAVVNGGITSENIAPGGINDPDVIGPGVEQALIPTGTILAFGGDAAPLGFLLCDGASVAVSSYPALHAIIAYKYGGSGGNFNVPNLKGRVPAGLDAAQGQFVTMGQAGGQVAATMPVHAHGGGNHTHGIFDPGHTHHPPPNVGGGQYVVTKNGFAGPQGESLEYAGPEGPQDLWFANNTGQDGTGITGTGASGSFIPAEGSGDNLPPYLVVNYIIKT